MIGYRVRALLSVPIIESPHMTSPSILIGRFLLGLYFFVPAIAKIISPDLQLDLMKSRDIAFAHPLLFFAGVSSVFGGVALMTGRYVKLAAYGFVIYTLLVNIMIHPFWTVETELQNFIKNLGIMSGLLVLAGYAPRRPLSLNGWWKSDRSILSL